MEAGSRKCTYCGYIVDPALPRHPQYKPKEPVIPAPPPVEFPKQQQPAYTMEERTISKEQSQEAPGAMDYSTVPMDVASQRDFKTLKTDHGGPIFKPGSHEEPKDWNFSKYEKSGPAVSGRQLLVAGRIIGVLAIICLLGFGIFSLVKWISTFPPAAAQQQNKPAQTTPTQAASTNTNNVVPTETPVKTTQPPPDTVKPVLSSINVAGISDQGATISWETDEKTQGSVIQYGTSEAYGNTVKADETARLSHSVILSGLNASTMYHYKIVTRDLAGNEQETNDRVFGTGAAIPVGIEVGNRAPDFTLKTLEGKSYTLSQLKGKLVMVNFWQVSCAGCVAEFPVFNEVYNSWNGTLKLELLAVDLDSYELYLRNFLEEPNHKYSFPILWDEQWTAADQYRIQLTPWTYFIDTNGIIFKKSLGRFDGPSQIIEILQYMK
jgi:peroxiredoxin